MDNLGRSLLLHYVIGHPGIFRLEHVMNVKRTRRRWRR